MNFIIHFQNEKIFVNGQVSVEISGNNLRTSKDRYYLTYGKETNNLFETNDWSIHHSSTDKNLVIHGNKPRVGYYTLKTLR